MSNSSNSFAQAERATNALARELIDHGIKANMRTVVMVPPGKSFASIAFALFKAGTIPVLIDPGIGIRNIGKCIEQVQPEAFVGTAKAQFARRIFGWGRGSTHLNFDSQQLLKRIANNRSDPVLVEKNPRDQAAILFTSGSTGPAKGAIYTHQMFQEQVRVLREVFTIEPGEIDLCTFPLFALFAPALGMTSVIPDMNPTRPARADPRKLIDAIQEFKVTNLFGSPALIDVLSRYGEAKKIRLPTLRRVISAGAPVSATIIERMCKMLNPGVQVFTPYGATEALPIAVLGSDEILGETRYETAKGAGICVGCPVDRIEVRIIPMTDSSLSKMPDQCLEPFQKGEIAVRGPVVSERYWNRPELDALHKVADGETTWHRTGDIGYFDNRGRLWFCGRKAHRVELSGQVLHTIPVEGVFNQHPDVFRTAIVGVKSHGDMEPVLCVEVEKNCRRSQRELVTELQELGSRHSNTKVIRHFLFHRGFPVDVRHNAKINREKLAVWAGRRLR